MGENQRLIIKGSVICNANFVGAGGQARWGDSAPPSEHGDEDQDEGYGQLPHHNVRELQEGGSKMNWSDGALHRIPVANPRPMADLEFKGVIDKKYALFKDQAARDLKRNKLCFYTSSILEI